MAHFAPGRRHLERFFSICSSGPEHVAAAHESGALSTDAIDAIVAAAASQWLDTPVAGSLTVSAEEALRSADRAWLDLLGNAILERTVAVLAGLGLGVAEVAVGRPRFRKQAGPPSAAAIGAGNRPMPCSTQSPKTPNDFIGSAGKPCRNPTQSSGVRPSKRSLATRGWRLSCSSAWSAWRNCSERCVVGC